MSAPHVFDRALLRHRRRRARALGAATFLIDRTAADLAERLSTVLRRFARAADLGSPPDAVGRGGGGVVGTLVAGGGGAGDGRAHARPRGGAGGEGGHVAESNA